MLSGLVVAVRCLLFTLFYDLLFKMTVVSAYIHHVSIMYLYTYRYETQQQKQQQLTTTYVQLHYVLKIYVILFIHSFIQERERER